MFPNCTQRFGRKKTKTKVRETNKEKPRKKKKNGNNSIYHEPLSEEWIGRRS